MILKKNLTDVLMVIIGGNKLLIFYKPECRVNKYNLIVDVVTVTQTHSSWLEVIAHRLEAMATYSQYEEDFLYNFRFGAYSIFSNNVLNTTFFSDSFEIFLTFSKAKPAVGSISYKPGKYSYKPGNVPKTFLQGLEVFARS